MGGRFVNRPYAGTERGTDGGKDTPKTTGRCRQVTVETYHLK